MTAGTTGPFSPGCFLVGFCVLGAFWISQTELSTPVRVRYPSICSRSWLTPAMLPSPGHPVPPVGARVIEVAGRSGHSSAMTPVLS